MIVSEDESLVDGISMGRDDLTHHIKNTRDKWHQVPSVELICKRGSQFSEIQPSLRAAQSGSSWKFILSVPPDSAQMQFSQRSAPEKPLTDVYVDLAHTNTWAGEPPVRTNLKDLLSSTTDMAYQITLLADDATPVTEIIKMLQICTNHSRHGCAVLHRRVMTSLQKLPNN